MIKSNSVLFAKVVKAVRLQAVVTQMVSNAVDVTFGLAEKMLRDNRDLITEQVKQFLWDGKALAQEAGLDIPTDAEKDKDDVSKAMERFGKAFDAALKDEKVAKAEEAKAEEAKAAAKEARKKPKADRAPYLTLKFLDNVDGRKSYRVEREPRTELYRSPLTGEFDVVDTGGPKDPIGTFVNTDHGVTFRLETSLALGEITLNGAALQYGVHTPLQHGDVLRFGLHRISVEIRD